MFYRFPPLPGRPCMRGTETHPGVGQSGRPPALGAGNRWFESNHPDRLLRCRGVWSSPLAS